MPPSRFVARSRRLLRREPAASAPHRPASGGLFAHVPSGSGVPAFMTSRAHARGIAPHRTTLARVQSARPEPAICTPGGLGRAHGGIGRNDARASFWRIRPPAGARAGPRAARQGLKARASPADMWTGLDREPLLAEPDPLLHGYLGETSAGTLKERHPVSVAMGPYGGRSASATESARRPRHCCRLAPSSWDHP
jgi:hypothetical protein